MKLEKLFEKIYFECNVKPLFERVFREAGVDRVGTGVELPGIAPDPVQCTDSPAKGQNDLQNRNPQEQKNRKKKPASETQNTFQKMLDDAMKKS